MSSQNFVKSKLFIPAIPEISIDVEIKINEGGYFGLHPIGDLLGLSLS